MASIILQGITKYIRNLKIIDDVSLHIEDGEFFCLIGPSGCGKTTLLRLVAGLDNLDYGMVIFDGEDVTNLPPSERDIAMVFQNFALFPHMNVKDNITFPLVVRKLVGEEIDARLARTIEALDIGVSLVLDRMPRQLSAGHQQRVALGRAIIRSKPRVLLLDEPLTNLDAKIRARTKIELKKLVTELNTTAIYVTPDPREAFALGKRIGVMDEGRLEQVGTPQELYERPNSVFVADFTSLLPINFFPGKVKKGNFSGEGIRFALPYDVEDGEDCILGIRSEHIHLTTEREKDTTRAVVESIQPILPELLVELDLGGRKCLAQATIDTPIEVGVVTYMKFELDKIHIFHKKSKKRLN